MTRILGPCRCQGCGARVYFDGLYWVGPMGFRHSCARVLALRRRKAA